MSDITLLDIPFDILSKIFKSLTLAELSHVMLTCKTLKNLIEEDYTIWRPFCGLFVRNSLNNSRPALSPYNLCRISRNWGNGMYKPKILYYYTKYMPWLKFHNSEAVLLSLGSKLACYQTNQHGIKDGAFAWRVEVPTVQRNDIRTNDISRFVLKNDLIICGNRDGCVAVYKYKGKKQKPQLLHHILDCHNEGRSEISAVELISIDNPIVVTVSSSSPSLCYWNIKGIENDSNLLVREKYQASATISVASVEGFRCLALNQSQTILAIGPNGNCKPLLLDVTTSRELSCGGDVTPNIKQAVRDVQWHDENTAAYVTHAGKLQFIDTRTYEVVYDSKDPFLVTLYCVKTDGDRAILAGSAAHSRCVLYDRRNARTHVQMYFASKRASPVYSLDFDSTTLIAAADLSLASLNFDVKPDKRRQLDYSSFNFQMV